MSSQKQVCMCSKCQQKIKVKQPKVVEEDSEDETQPPVDQEEDSGDSDCETQQTTTQHECKQQSGMNKYTKKQNGTSSNSTGTTKVGALAPSRITDTFSSPSSSTIPLPGPSPIIPDDSQSDMNTNGKWAYEADYIVVGLGAAGTIATHDLSQNFNNKVLAFEMGANRSADPIVQAGSTQFGFVPAINVLTYSNKYAVTGTTADLHNSTTDTLFEVFNMGRMWGGSSAHNFMQAVRGSADLYDEWGAVLGDDKWDYESLLPVFKSLEKVVIEPTNSNGTGSGIKVNKHQRGTKGPLTFVQDYIDKDPVLQAFDDIGGPLSGSTRATTGAPGNFRVSGDDYNLTQNTLESTPCNNALGLFLQQRFVTPELNPGERHRRFGVNALLGPDVVTPEGKGVGGRQLRILSNSPVQRVIFSKKDPLKAVGVLYNYKGVSYYAKARKEVILCAGCPGSSTILQHSGIGDQQVLKQARVDLRYHNPNVGNNLTQHYGIAAQMNVPGPPLNPSGETFLDRGWNTGFLFADGSGSKRYGSGFVKGRRNFQYSWVPFQFDIGTGVDQTVTASANVSVTSPYPLNGGNPNLGQSTANRISWFGWNLRPKATGTCFISNNNPSELPEMIYGFYTDSDELKDGSDSDLTASAAMVDILIEWAEQAGTQVVVPPASNIVGNGVAANDPNNFSQNTIAKDTLKSLSSLPVSYPWHPVGTCRMASSAQDGVCDSNMKVFGVKNLSVADNSVVPGKLIATGNTCNMAYMLGRRKALLSLQAAGQQATIDELLKNTYHF